MQSCHSIALGTALAPLTHLYLAVCCPLHHLCMERLLGGHGVSSRLLCIQLGFQELREWCCCIWGSVANLFNIRSLRIRCPVARASWNVYSPLSLAFSLCWGSQIPTGILLAKKVPGFPQHCLVPEVLGDGQVLPSSLLVQRQALGLVLLVFSQS